MDASALTLMWDIIQRSTWDMPCKLATVHLMMVRTSSHSTIPIHLHVARVANLILLHPRRQHPHKESSMSHAVAFSRNSLAQSSSGWQSTSGPCSKELACTCFARSTNTLRHLRSFSSITAIWGLVFQGEKTRREDIKHTVSC